MANFNTYQTRQLYVAKAVDSSLDTVGDIYLKTTANGKAFFNYVNADGLLVATDVFDPKNIVSLRKTEAADMDRPLVAHTITVDSSVTLANLVGKSINLNVFCSEFMSYDPAAGFMVTASIVGDASNTASTAAFNKAIAKALVKAVPKFAGEKPFKVFIGATEITKDLADGSYPGSGALIIVEAMQKWYRNKMEAGVLPLVISSNVDGEAWAVDTPAKSTITNNSVIPSVYFLADLEAFALGERADYIRYGNEPDYEPPTYMIDVAKSYDVVSIEYYWQGGAENVQKSPRMIQIACEVSGSGSQATSAAGSIYDAVLALTGESAASGSGA
jgi:hypothetical protein